MSGPAVESLVLEGGLNALTSQLTKVKSVKTKKLNALKKTIERFNVDQNNLELWEAMRQDKKVSDDTGEAFTILMDTCILKGEFHSNFFTAELCLSMSDKLTLHNALFQFHYPIFHNLALKVLIWP